MEEEEAEEEEEEEAAADWIADVAVEDVVAFVETIQNSGDQFIATKRITNSSIFYE